jgi:hypothetical protein
MFGRCQGISATVQRVLDWRGAHNCCRNRHCVNCQGSAAKGSPSARPSSCRISRRVLAAGPNRRRCLPEQGRNLRHPDQGFGRDVDHHRCRSQTSPRPRRRPPFFTLGALTHHPPRSYDRPSGGISLDGEDGSPADPTLRSSGQRVTCGNAHRPRPVHCCSIAPAKSTARAQQCGKS